MKAELLVACLTAAFTCVGAIFAFLARRQGVENNIQGQQIHSLVNSQFTQAKKEITEGNVMNAVLLRKIATLTNTTEDEIRAEVAEELARRFPQPLPRQEKA